MAEAMSDDTAAGRITAFLEAWDGRPGGARPDQIAAVVNGPLRDSGPDAWLTKTDLRALLGENERLRAELETANTGWNLEREAFDNRGARVMQQRAELAAAWKERNAATARAEQAEGERDEAQQVLSFAHRQNGRLLDRALKAEGENERLRTWLDELGYDALSVAQRLREPTEYRCGSDATGKDVCSEGHTYAPGQCAAAASTAPKTLEQLTAEQAIKPVTDPAELSAPESERLTDAEFESWQAAMQSCRELGPDDDELRAENRRLWERAAQADYGRVQADLRASKVRLVLASIIQAFSGSGLVDFERIAMWRRVFEETRPGADAEPSAAVQHPADGAERPGDSSHSSSTGAETSEGENGAQQGAEGMRPEDVGSDLIEAAWQALGKPKPVMPFVRQTKQLLAAVLPLHAQQVEQQARERIAAERNGLPRGVDECHRIIYLLVQRLGGEVEIPYVDQFNVWSGKSHLIASRNNLAGHLWIAAREDKRAVEDGSEEAGGRG